MRQKLRKTSLEIPKQMKVVIMRYLLSSEYNVISHEKRVQPMMLHILTSQSSAAEQDDRMISSTRIRS